MEKNENFFESPSGYHLKICKQAFMNCAHDTFYQFDYPTLEKASRSAFIKKDSHRYVRIEGDSKVTVKKDTITQAITIIDHQLNVEYVLFKSN